METMINEVEVNGIKYVRKDSVVPTNYTGEIKIVVLQRGWVYIGRLEKVGNLCKLHNASCIRVWGTTKGLPELTEGALSGTKLDKCLGIVEFDWLTVIHTIAVNQDKWKM